MTFPDAPYEKAKEDHFSHQSKGEFYSRRCTVCRNRYSLGLDQNGTWHMVNTEYNTKPSESICNSEPSIMQIKHPDQLKDKVTCSNCMHKIKSDPE